MSLHITTGKNGFQGVAWTLFFLLCFRVMSRFPAGMIEEGLFLGLVLFVAAVSIMDMIRAASRGNPSHFHFILIPLLLLPFISAWQAKAVFRQPFLLGLLTQRQHFILFCGYFSWLALERGWIRAEILRIYFIRALYLSVGIMAFFYIFVDPSIYKETDFVKYTLNKGWQYEFPQSLAAIVMVHALIEAWSERRRLAYAVFLLTAGYFVVFGQDRSQLLFAGITLFVYFVKNLDAYRKFKQVFLLGGILLATITALQLFRPDLLDHYFRLFANASSIVTGAQTDEHSTNIRYVESAIALRGFSQHPWLGNGTVSAQFQGGFRGFFGYFYPGDVGILGNLFVYGILGTLVFYIPFFLALRWSLQMRGYSPPFLMTCTYALLFIFLDMLTAAVNIKFIGLQAFCFAVIYYYRFTAYPEYIRLRNSSEPEPTMA
jgi:hypothetical protein